MMKTKIETDTLPLLLSELQCMSFKESRAPIETLCTKTRDILINVGVGLIVCGSYLVMLGSNKGGDSSSKAAQFHLKRLLLPRVGSSCDACGHNNCSVIGCMDKTPSNTVHDSIHKFGPNEGFV